MRLREESAEMQRVMRAIAVDGATVELAADKRVRLKGADGRFVTTTAALLDGLARRGLLERDGVGLRLSQSGDAWIRRLDGGEEPFLAQHRDTEAIVVRTAAGMERAKSNSAESPLTQLARRKDRAGRPILDPREVAAGEKLRGDYERGQIMPRIGANWSSTIATGRRAGAATDLSDGALAARMRVERALDAVGPELSGVLVDICCFLKGLETVEMERGWPVRSAKIVLKTALSALARHYDPTPPRPRMVGWATPDNRPSRLGPD